MKILEDTVMRGVSGGAETGCVPTGVSRVIDLVALTGGRLTKFDDCDLLGAILQNGAVYSTPNA